MHFPSVQAARFSGDYLLQVCGSDEQGKELLPGGHIACQAYISGVMDYHNLIRSLGAAPSVDFCVPEGTPLKEIHQKVWGYIASHHHEQGPFIAAPGVALGLFSAYPCEASD
ncbi:MAG TPA: Rap1a/Tai family immunity protein [Alphaproteobacteria bacterium]|nr:Rap1a/Tai family immunity protein [Alphaproteobacteria bacterium]